MIEALHPAAIGLTTVAALLHPGWRRGAAVAGLLAMLLMLAAMVDVVVVHAVGIMLWVAVLVAAGIGLSAFQAWRRRAGGSVAETPVAAFLDALGLVVMAALLPMMPGGVGGTDAGAHVGHGAAVGGLLTLVLATALPHLLVSAVATARGARASERLMHALMGGATLPMAAHALGHVH